MSRYHRHAVQKKHRALVVRKRANNKFIDRLTFMSAVAEPLVTLPQVYTVLHTKTAAGISISAWIGYELFAMVWIWYGFVHKDKMIILYQGLYFILDGAVLVGAFKYGGHW